MMTRRIEQEKQGNRKEAVAEKNKKHQEEIKGEKIGAKEKGRRKCKDEEKW